MADRSERVTATRARTRELLALGAWFGFLTGLAEAALRVGARAVLPDIIHFDPQMVWMAPLADGLLFSFVALLLVPVACRWPTEVMLPRITLPLGFLGFLSLVTQVPRLHKVALAVIALGLAVQSARLAARHPAGFERLVRRTLGPVALLVFLLAMVVNGIGIRREREALSALPSSAPGAPNVLLIILDTVRAASLSLYGYDRPTSPNLAQLARRGVSFDLAIAAAPWTLPSHASVFTGQWPHELSADWKSPLNDAFPTLAESLAARGYRTAGFVANDLYTGYESGLDRGFAHYADYQITLGQMVQNIYLGRLALETCEKVFRTVYAPQRKGARSVGEELLEWLPKDDRRPFFAFLNYFDAHDPYRVPQAFHDEFKTTDLRWRRLRLGRYTPEEIRYYHDAYDGAIAYLDYELGRLFDELDRRGTLKNTLVIITSDHGEEFGEHDFMGHGGSLYLPEIRVPLLIIDPSRVPTERHILEPASLRDLPATILDLVGPPTDSNAFGRTMARYWDRERFPDGPGEAPILSEVNFAAGLAAWYPLWKGDMKAIVRGRFHYIRNGDGREELYDVLDDPNQENNLAGDSATGDALAGLRADLDSILAGTKRLTPR